MKLGKASIQFDHPVTILGAACVAGPKEAEGPLGNAFDEVDQDGTFGQKNWEESESQSQNRAIQLAIEKARIAKSWISYLFAGDLLGQSIASSFGAKEFGIPHVGLYGACATIGEALILGAMTVNAGYAEHVLCATSSHYASAEREFRFPSDYGNQRPMSASWTVTGAAAFVLGDKKGDVRITGATIGKIVDYGMKDSMNMGASMAPAAADTIYRYFRDFVCNADYFDQIITGDLGLIGSDILKDQMLAKGYDIRTKHSDCGLFIYDCEKQDVHAGGSGCACSAIVLSSYIIPKLTDGTWKRVLFVPTGALLSKTSFQEGQSIPGIAHAVCLEYQGKR